MADKAFDRAFTKAFASTQAVVEDLMRPPAAASNSNAAAAEDGAPMTAADAVSRILKHQKDSDYFQMLQLPPPTVNALGRPQWEVSAGQVSRAYRKLSILVHPDKNPGDDARKAFEALNDAYRRLKDPSALEEVLRNQAGRIRAQQDRKESAADLSARVQLNAAKNAAAQQARKTEGASLQAQVLETMRRRQEESKRRREAASNSKYRSRAAAADDDDGAEDAGGSSAAAAHVKGRQPSDDGGVVPAAKRKKPTFLY